MPISALWRCSCRSISAILITYVIIPGISIAKHVRLPEHPYWSGTTQRQQELMYTTMRLAQRPTFVAQTGRQERLWQWPDRRFQADIHGHGADVAVIEFFKMWFDHPTATWAGRSTNTKPSAFPCSTRLNNGHDAGVLSVAGM